ncbi:MAG: oligogalacturonate lyase family protein [Firmicutes bacterium]|nr:oligogalacturonate lyase family protein [Bacillota bacterium]
MRTDRIVTITDDLYEYTAGYYVTNKWIDNDTLVGMRAADRIMDANQEVADDKQLVKISLTDGSIEVIDTGVKYATFSEVKNGKLYYNDKKGIIELDLKTDKKRYVCETDAGYLQLTADGAYASVFTGREGTPSRFYRVDIKTGEIEKLMEINFSEPFDVANHLMISPQDKDLFFFAHEGDCRYITNRLWLYNARTKKQWNIARQTLSSDGALGDCFGHEMWAPDGKGIWFAKYAVSPEPPRGICYVDIETGKYKLLYSKYKYWHVGVSADGRYVVADTQYDPHQSEVVIVDRETDEETVIDMPYMTGKHPCHPHPQLSPDNKKVVYTALDKEGGRTCIKVAYLK